MYAYREQNVYIINDFFNVIFKFETRVGVGTAQGLSGSKVRSSDETESYHRKDTYFPNKQYQNHSLMEVTTHLGGLDAVVKIIEELPINYRRTFLHLLQLYVYIVAKTVACIHRARRRALLPRLGLL